MSEENICPVCYDEINNGFIKLNCNHILDLKCFIRLIETNGFDRAVCPLCRDSISNNFLENDDDDDDSVDDEDNLSFYLDKITYFITRNEHFIFIILLMIILFKAK